MVTVREWDRTAEAWDAFVHEAGDGSVMHLHAWDAVVREAYGHQTFHLAAFEGDRVLGVLPLVLVNSRVLRPNLVSMPFMDYGGPCVGPHVNAEAALIDAAREIAARHDAFLTLRCLRQAGPSLPCSLDKLTVFLELGADEEALWRSLPSERRNRIRKGQKSGLTASFHGPESLKDFYAVFSANMRDIGSPVHSLQFFRKVMIHLGHRTRIVLVRWQGRPIGAGLMLLFKGMISIPWVSSLRSFFDKCPNQVLYWETMRFGIAQGLRVLDFGRSSRDSGTFEAKRQWQGDAVQLYWHYYPETAEPPGEDVKHFRWAAGVWQRLPLPLANVMGPWLRRGIPN